MNDKNKEKDINKKCGNGESETEKNSVKYDKYGVCLDSEEYLKRSEVASNTDHTGIVPVAMDNCYNEESYEAMFNHPVDNIEDRVQKRKNAGIKE